MKKKKIIKLLENTMAKFHKAAFDLCETRKELARQVLENIRLEQENLRLTKVLFCGKIEPLTKSKCYMIPNHEGEHIGYSKESAANIFWNTEKESK